MGKLQMAVVVLACALGVAQAAESRSESIIEEVHGRQVAYCNYKGLKVLPASKIYDYDTCGFCTCSVEGLFCVSNFYFVPKESEMCKVVTVACHEIWVLKADTTTDCPEEFMPKSIGMVGK